MSKTEKQQIDCSFCYATLKKYETIIAVDYRCIPEIKDCQVLTLKKLPYIDVN